MHRPDPDLLLAHANRTEARKNRGHLKIFFGAAAGVGKTFSMLRAGRAYLAEGRDVVVGLVETHGRVETQAQLEGLEQLPLQIRNNRGIRCMEFDLDAALDRNPDLILLDELAHTNLTGSRHPKRWQDVRELLDSGIDVYTTLNVQHLESLHEDVGRFAGIQVWETVPDTVFEEADEVELVDLPPDDLLVRLREGKVYLPDKAERALSNFFRKGNLIALRELALRRTAERVDAQMQDYRQEYAIHEVWNVGERMLVCLGPTPQAERLIRAAKRLATSLHKLVWGTPSRKGWRRWFLGSVVDSIISQAHDVNFYLLGNVGVPITQTKVRSAGNHFNNHRDEHSYGDRLWGIAIPLALTLIDWPFREILTPPAIFCWSICWGYFSWPFGSAFSLPFWHH